MHLCAVSWLSCLCISKDAKLLQALAHRAASAVNRHVEGASLKTKFVRNEHLKLPFQVQAPDQLRVARGQGWQ